MVQHVDEIDDAEEERTAGESSGEDVECCLDCWKDGLSAEVAQDRGDGSKGGEGDERLDDPEEIQVREKGLCEEGLAFSAVGFG